MAKYCKKCGTLIDKDYNFCTNCGATVDSFSNSFTENEQYDKSFRTYTKNKQEFNPDETDNSLKILIIAIVVCISIVAAVGFFLWNQENTTPVSFSQEDGLVAYWNFDRGWGISFIDTSTNDNNGVIHDATWVNGVSGYALSFDGINDYAYISDNDELRSDDVSLALWIYPTKNDTDCKWLIGKACRDKWGNQDACSYGINCFDYEDDGTTEICGVFEKNNNKYTAVTYTIPSLYRWYHVVLTFNDLNQEANLYVDGILQDTADHGQSLRYNSPWDFLIGAAHKGTGSGVNEFGSCIIDEVFVYNRVLDYAEINSLYDNP